jgi:hypothetical protein
MLTALDADPDALDPAARDFVRTIRQSGWIATHVHAAEASPGFTYTTGLWATAGLPEMIVFGLDMESAHRAFTAVIDRERRGELLTGAPIDALVEGRRAALFGTDRCKHAEFMPLTQWFYDHPGFLCLQIVLADEKGVLPWEDDCEPAFRPLQPDLTVSGWTATLAGAPPA